MSVNRDDLDHQLASVFTNPVTGSIARQMKYTFLSETNLRFYAPLFRAVDRLNEQLRLELLYLEDIR